MNQYRFAFLLAIVFSVCFPMTLAAQEGQASSARIVLDDASESDEADEVQAVEEDSNELSEGEVNAEDVQISEVDTEQASADEWDADETPIVKGHGFQLGMTFAGVPGYVLDGWFDYHGNVWDGTANMGFSLDYFLRFSAPCEMRFSLSWLNAGTGDAYWLRSNRSDSPWLADYVENGISFVNIEVAAYHMIPIIDEIAFYYGGGLWGGVRLGDAYSYDIRSECGRGGGDLNACPHDPGRVKVMGLPQVMGFVMVTLGFKFTVWDIMTIRAEGGFKGYFYGQLGLGVEF